MKKIAKGINLAAVGLLIIVLNVNLDLGAMAINILPDWLGLILLFLAVGQFEDKKNRYLLLKLLIIIATIYDMAEWVLSFVHHNFDLFIPNIVYSIVQMIIFWSVTSVIIRVARESSSSYVGSLVTIRGIQLVSQILNMAMSLLTVYIDEWFAMGVAVTGVIMLLAVIITIVIMFAFKKEYREKLEA